MRFKILSIIFFIMSCGKVSSQINNGEIEKIKSTFAKEYIFNKKLEILKDISETKGFDNYALRDAKTLLFQSKKSIKANTSLWFSVNIYCYSSSEDAINQFNKIKESLNSDSETFFSKNWNFVIVKGNNIYKVNGGCIYSKISWDKLKQSFIGILYTINEDILEKSFTLPCGGL